MEITSPFTWRDFLTQRRRWLWGNIHAVTHVLPWRSSILLVALYSFGVVTFLISTIGIVLVFTGAVRYSSSILPLLLASTALWLGLFVISGWINSGGGESSGLRRAWDVIAAVLLAFVTSAVAIGVQVVALCMGNPHRFEVIQKSDPKDKKPSLATAWDEEPSLELEPVVHMPDPEPVVHMPDPVVDIPEPAEQPRTLPG
jgi:hypothetical protein